MKILGPEDDCSDVAWRVTGSCLGFLASSYNVLAADLVTSMMQNFHGDQVVSETSRHFLWGIQLGGLVLGMVGFGLASDLVGRRWTSVVSASLLTLGALASVFVMPHLGSGHEASRLPWEFGLCRFAMFLGAGGEFPLALTVAADAARGLESRGQLLALLASMYGLSMLLLGGVCFGALSLQLSHESSWRLMLAAGALPAWEAAFLRLRMETVENSGPYPDVAWRFEDMLGPRGAMARGGRRPLWRQQLHQLGKALQIYWPQLLGGMAVWLLTDASLHRAASLRGHPLGDSLGYGALTPEGKATMDAWFLIACGAITTAGVAVAALLVGRVGASSLQLYGFVAAAAAFFAASLTVGLTVGRTARGGLLPSLAAALFFLSLGPRAATLVSPTEAFPACARGTFVGLCAACGELGALLGVLVRGLSETGAVTPIVLVHCGSLALLGAVASVLSWPKEGDPSMLESPRLAARVSLNLYGHRARCDFQGGFGPSSGGW